MTLGLVDHSSTLVGPVDRNWGQCGRPSPSGEPVAAKFTQVRIIVRDSCQSMSDVGSHAS
jgi:hypothetical protein